MRLKLTILLCLAAVGAGLASQYCSSGHAPDALDADGRRPHDRLTDGRVAAAKAALYEIHRWLDRERSPYRKRRTGLGQHGLSDPLARLREVGASHLKVDPWGNQYVYRPGEGREYQLRTSGPDGTADTDDDIYWPTPATAHQGVARGGESDTQTKPGHVGVLVLGPDGKPVPFLPLEARFPFGSFPSHIATDASGRASIYVGKMKWTGTLAVDGGPDTVPIDREPIILRLPRVVLATLDAVDGETGDPIAGVKWKTSAWTELAGAGQPRAIPKGPGAPYFIVPTIEVPTAGVAADPRTMFGWLSRQARSTLVRYPIRREARVRAEVVDATGRKIDDPYFWSPFGPGEHYLIQDVRVEKAGEGAFWLRGLSFFRDTRVLLGVMDRELIIDENAKEEGAGPLMEYMNAMQGGVPPEPGRLDPVRWTKVRSAGLLSGTHAQSATVELRLRVSLPAAGADGTKIPLPRRRYLLGGDSGGHDHIGPGIWFDNSPYPHGEIARITVQVLNWNGTPARDVRVRWPHGLLETDDEGGVSVTNVKPGTYKFELVEPDMLPTEIIVEARVGRIQKHLLQEPSGGKLDIRVVDTEGRGLPYARVAVRARRATPILWDDLERRVQRLDPFTDLDGSRLYEHVSPGTVQITAMWADRWGETTATVTKGELTVIRIVPVPPKY